MDDSVIINPVNGPATHVVIWLHGLGADGHDFEGIIPALKLDQVNVRFIFPHAPVRPITINGGAPMRGWFDIANLNSLDHQVDQNGIEDSVSRLNGLVDQQIKEGIAPGNIVLAGFSQGGVIALIAGLQATQPLAGVLGLSTYLPCWHYFRQSRQPGSDRMPFQLAHGKFDPVIPYQAGEYLYNCLDEEGLNVDFQAYPMQHEVCEEEIELVAQWLHRVFGLRVQN